jgi:hypothetical protein
MQILKFSNVSFKRLTSVTQYLAILVRSTAHVLELQIKQNKTYLGFLSNVSVFIEDYLKSCLLFQRTTSGDVWKTNKFSGFGFPKEEEFREKTVTEVSIGNKKKL